MATDEEREQLSREEEQLPEAMQDPPLMEPLEMLTRPLEAPIEIPIPFYLFDEFVELNDIDDSSLSTLYNEVTQPIAVGSGGITQIRTWAASQPFKPLRLLLIALMLCFALTGSVSAYAFWLSKHISADHAFITLTPASQHLTDSDTFYAIRGTPDSTLKQIKANLISYITPSKSLTVKTTGHRHLDATQAHGNITLTVTDGAILSGTSIRFMLPRKIRSGRVSINVYVPNTLSKGQSGIYPARVETVGSAGNIAANVLQGLLTSRRDHVSFYAYNTAFTGGLDAQDYSSVQQSDIDYATSILKNEFSSADMAAAQQAVQQQLSTHEQFLTDVFCTPTVTTNHKINDSSADVTVSMALQCQRLAYHPQDVQSLMTSLFDSKIASAFGDNFTLIDKPDIAVSPVSFPRTENNIPLAFHIDADGTWGLRFTSKQEHTFATLIAGKSVDDASKLLMRQQGIKKVTITTSGFWGSAIPASPEDITIQISNSFTDAYAY